MDYEHLRAKVIANAISDHHTLLDFVNREWAHPLGFSMKLKRPPKDSKNGKSVRFYCTLYNSNQTEEDCEDIHKETGLCEEYCYFGLSFKQVEIESKHNKHKLQGIWILNTDYCQDRMYHNHPFFYSYATQDQVLGVVYTDASTNHNSIHDMSCGEDPHSADEAMAVKVDENEIGLVR